MISILQQKLQMKNLNNLLFIMNMQRRGKMQLMQDSKRNSNLELLRIVAMTLITFNHIVSLGNSLDGANSVNILLLLFFLLGGKFGTNLFVILGLWFLIDKEFKFKRIIQIWVQTLFYSVFLNIIDIVILGIHITPLQIIKSLFPLIGRYYWFSFAYIIMLFAVPLLRKIYTIFNKKILVMIGGIVLSILPTITFNGAILIGNSDVIRLLFKVLLWGPIWFCYLFLLVSYVKYDSKNLLLYNRKKYGLIFITCYFIMFCIMASLYLYGKSGNVYSSFASDNYATIRDMSSLPCIVGAFSLFLYFYKTNIRLSYKINRFAKYMFGIYLLQCHPNSINFIWNNLLPFNKFNTSYFFWIYSIFSVLMIFLLGILIEIFRVYVMRCIFNKIKKYRLGTLFEKYI